MTSSRLMRILRPSLLLIAGACSSGVGRCVRLTLGLAAIWAYTPRLSRIFIITADVLTDRELLYTELESSRVFNKYSIMVLSTRHSIWTKALILSWSLLQTF